MTPTGSGVPPTSPKTMALAALDIGAYGFMRLYECSGRLQVPGLVLAGNARAERLLSRIPLIQRLAVEEQINVHLIALGLEALARARSGTTLMRIDELLLELASDDEDVAERILAQGLAVDRVSNGEAVEELVVEITLADGRILATRRSAEGGAPRDAATLRLRAAGVLLWAHLTGSVDAGPVPPRDPGAFLAQLKENRIRVKRAFNPAVVRTGIDDDALDAGD